MREKSPFFGLIDEVSKTGLVKFRNNFPFEVVETTFKKYFLTVLESSTPFTRQFRDGFGFRINLLTLKYNF